MEAKDQDLRRTEEAWPLPTLDLEMRDIQNDVPVTSSAGPETPRAATVADAGAENDVAWPHSRVHDDEPELADVLPARPRAGPSGAGKGDVSGGPAARVGRSQDVPDPHRRY